MVEIDIEVLVTVFDSSGMPEGVTMHITEADIEELAEDRSANAHKCASASARVVSIKSKF